MRMVRRSLALVPLCAAVLLAGCGVSIDERQSGDRTAVDIRTPLGDLAVRADATTPPETGLSVYPGARPIGDRGREHDNATVAITTPFFGLNIAAAQFESDAVPQAVLDYYKGQMASYGPVTECRGDIDFKGRRGAEQPVCKEKRRARDTQLVVGTEGDHRLVAVKSRGTGTEFAVVHIRAGGAG